MGSVDVTIRGHRHRLIITFTTMKFSFVASLGAIIGQADNVIPNVMQSVLAHPNRITIAHVQDTITNILKYAALKSIADRNENYSDRRFIKMIVPLTFSSQDLVRR